MLIKDGITIDNSFDHDDEIQINFETPNDMEWLNLEEAEKLAKHLFMAIDSRRTEKFNELMVNPDVCSGCHYLKETIEDDGVDYNCRANNYSECHRI